PRPPPVRGEGIQLRSLHTNAIRSKSECKTFVHFMMTPFRTVILSAAKNLTPRLFAEFILSVAEGLRVTIRVYQFYAVFSSVCYAHGKRRAERQTCAQRTLQRGVPMSCILV